MLLNAVKVTVCLLRLMLAVNTSGESASANVQKPHGGHGIIACTLQFLGVCWLPCRCLMTPLKSPTETETVT